MSRRKSNRTKNSPPAIEFLNLEDAAQITPQLELIVLELRQGLDRVETLHYSFRQKFLSLFNEEGYAAEGASGRTALRGLYFYHHANLGGHCLPHMRYAVDMADQACALLSLEIQG